MPIIKKAIEALNTIQPKDINEIKVLGKPPGPIRKVLHAVCIMCQRKAERTPKKENPKEMEENWWLTSQRFMAEKDFMKTLLEYDRDNIPDSVVIKLRKEFIGDPDFKPSRVQQASMAAKGLCMWVRALDEYDKVAKHVAPKRARAREAEASYQITMESLREKQSELRAVVQQFEILEAQFKEALSKQQNLIDDIEDCKRKLERAV
jgi:dynein heavy chain